MREVEERLTALEKRQAEIEKGLAVDAERRKHMDSRFDRLEMQNDQIRSQMKDDAVTQRQFMQRIMWLVISIVIAALAQFVLKGGLNV